MAESGGETRVKIQAILLATSESDAFGTIVEHAPVEMMPLANQPFIGRVVGTLASVGVRESLYSRQSRGFVLAISRRRDALGRPAEGDQVASEAQLTFTRLPEVINAEHADRACFARRKSARRCFSSAGRCGSGWMLRRPAG
jgi:hypothetical protein